MATESDQRNIFVRWAAEHIHSHPGQTARDIVEEYLRQGLYTGFAKDPKGSLVATLHLYATADGFYHPNIPVHREEVKGTPYTFWPLS